MSEQQVDRRSALKYLGGAGVAAALGTALVADEAEAATTKVAYDMAFLGQTFRLMPNTGPETPPDLRGSTFIVEGRIYRKGTIDPGEVFDPNSASHIGHWFCRGWFITDGDRPDPQLLTQQEFILGVIGAIGRLYPRDQLVTSGLEGQADGTDPAAEAPVRSIIGGTGQFSTARGACLQSGWGTNTTQVGLVGEHGPAPNFRFHFYIK